MQTIKWLPLALLAFAACSNNSGGGNDAGTDTQQQNDAPASGYKQTGRIVDFTSKNPIAGATVSSGSASATTGTDGKYSLDVPQDTAYTMTISNDGYLTLHEQEWKLSGDANRGDTSAVANGIENLLKNALSPLPDGQLGVLSINVYATGSCASPIGAVLDAPGAATADGGGGNVHIVYFANGFPSSGTSVQDTGTPSAIIYNLPVGTFSQVTVTHPTCTPVAFPVADPSIPTMTYTGNVKLDPSGPMDDAGVVQNVASFMRVYLK